MCVDDEIPAGAAQNSIGSDDVSQSPLERVPFDGGVPVPGNDEPGPRLFVRHQQADVQLCSLRPRTSGAHAPEIGAARQSLGRPEPIVLRRRRTSTAASL